MNTLLNQTQSAEQTTPQTQEKKPLLDDVIAKTVPFVEGKGLMPSDLDGMWRVAQSMANSSFLPKGIKTIQDVFVCIQFGMELGLSPMQSVQNIAPINGRPTLWGDAFLAVVMSSRDFVNITEEVTGEGMELIATCTVERKKRKPVTRTFSMRDAERAHLHTRDTYKNYPQRMCPMRARSWACRDAFPDVLKGIRTPEDIDVDSLQERLAHPYVDHNIPDEKNAVDSQNVGTEIYNVKSIKPEPEKDPEENTADELGDAIDKDTQKENPYLSDEDVLNDLSNAGKKLDAQDVPTGNRKVYDPETNTVINNGELSNDELQEVEALKNEGLPEEERSEKPETEPPQDINKLKTDLAQAELHFDQVCQDNSFENEDEWMAFQKFIGTLSKGNEIKRLEILRDACANFQQFYKGYTADKRAKEGNGRALAQQDAEDFNSAATDMQNDDTPARKTNKPVLMSDGKDPCDVKTWNHLRDKENFMGFVIHYAEEFLKRADYECITKLVGKWNRFFNPPGIEPEERNECPISIKKAMAYRNALGKSPV